MKLDIRYELMEIPAVKEGLKLENITRNDKTHVSLAMNDGSSLYKFLWDYIIYRANLSDSELDRLQETCNVYLPYSIILFQFIIKTCDGIFKRGYINNGFREDYDFLFKTNKQESPEEERNYIQSPQDEIPCYLPSGTFVMTARSVKEIGIEELEGMLEDAEQGSTMNDPVKRIRKEDYEQHLIDRCPHLTNPIMYSSFLKALERRYVEDMTSKIISSAVSFASSKGFEHSLGINTEKGLPSRITDGEFIFPPTACKAIGAENLYKLMHDANNRAKAKENVRAYGS